MFRLAGGFRAAEVSSQQGGDGVADQLFKILVIRPGSTASFLNDPHFTVPFRARILGQFNDLVAKASQNDRVRAGFVFVMCTEYDPPAKKEDSQASPTLFWARLVQEKIPNLKGLLADLAPHMQPDKAIRQLSATGEGGVGAIADDGSWKVAFASTTAFENQLGMGRDSQERLGEAGRQLGGLVCHELGHSMGCADRPGNSLMNPVSIIDLDEPGKSLWSNGRFAEADIATMVATLNKVAEAVTKKDGAKAGATQSGPARSEPSKTGAKTGTK